MMAISRMLTKLRALTFLALGVQTAVLVSTIAMCVKLYEINMELSAISDRITAISSRIEQR